MENLLNCINWLKNNWQDVLAIYGGLVAICTVIVKCTKTDVDNKILDKVITVVDTFSTAFTSKDKKVLEKNKKK